ncbi:MAG: 3-phosphoshikimate 1-carboxyvinyltransferase [Acidimicrobiia bacterium]|nr:3-phosphoshikimate 1-carboxyvinyltransferase [Acidimicrobiia bacterium]
MNTYPVVPRPVKNSAVRPPGSKSITNRALISSALAAGRSELIDPLISDDTRAMMGCLRELGVRISVTDRSITVESAGLLRGGTDLDAGASGTTARFITAAATLADSPSRIDGTPRMRERPIGPLVAALRALGAGIEADRNGAYPPVRVEGGGLVGGRVTIDGSLSSQFVSAVLLSSPQAETDVVLDLAEGTVSRPYLDTTLEVMTAFGADARWIDSGTIVVAPTGYRPTRFKVEADASAAVYPWVAAAITGATITVTGIPSDSSQADLEALTTLRRMGCTITSTSKGISVTGPDQPMGVEADLNDCPDASLALAVVAAFASSGSRFTNLANLRVKETDRLAALEAELTRLGAVVETGPDWISIRPGRPRPALIRTYDDHRMAMSFAIAGLVQPGIVIEDPACVTKTWPGFFDMLESL